MLCSYCHSESLSALPLAVKMHSVHFAHHMLAFHAMHVLLMCWWDVYCVLVWAVLLPSRPVRSKSVQVQGDVLALHEIAAKLRAKRFGSGALRLDNTKLNFSLDADGNPDDAHPHGELHPRLLIAVWHLAIHAAK